MQPHTHTKINKQELSPDIWFKMEGWGHAFYLSFLLKIHGKKNSEDSRDLVLGRMTWINESDFNIFLEYHFSSVAQSCPTLRPHESKHARPPCPSTTPGVHSDSCPSSQWCHPAISSSVVPFSSCPQSLPASESFPMNQLFAWGGQSTGVSALASFLQRSYQNCFSKLRKRWGSFIRVASVCILKFV